MVLLNMSIKNRLKLLLAAIITISSFLIAPNTALALGNLTVTKITASKTYATADNTYSNGWSWIFDVTVPTNETDLNMKFTNWASGSNSIPIAANARFYSAQSLNASNENSAITLNSAETYSSVMNIDPTDDLDAVTGGIQIQITVDFKIPVDSVDGSYSTTYGVQTIDPNIALVAADKASLVGTSIKGTNPDLSNITVGLTNPLPSNGANGSAISWVSDTPSIVSDNGQTINRPLSTSENATVVLTATLTKGAVSDSKAFTLTVIKNAGAQATPTFDPTAGAIAFGNTVTISSAGADAIYYTTNGSTPTRASTNQATTPLVINTAVTVKALAVKAGYDDSDIGSATYTQAAATAPSNIVLAVGSANAVGGVTNVAIPEAGATDTTGAVTGWIADTNDKIKFTVTDASGSSTITINGNDYLSGTNYQIPSTSSLSIIVTTTETGKITGTRTFTVTVAPAPTQATPTFDPAAGAIAFGNTVTISSAGADAIYYTTNGSTPTRASTNQATTPLVINTAVTVKALAVKAGYDDSDIGSAVYTALSIGTNYKGGKVAYILTSGNPGYNANIQHGLIATAADQGSVIVWANVDYQNTTVTGADGTAIGTGNQNTIDIVAQNGAGDTFAAGVCSNLSEGGYDDWYLPSKDELNKLYTNRVAIGGFSGYYFSSSEGGAGNAWNQNFSNGVQNNGLKSDTNRVRAVRAF